MGGQILESAAKIKTLVSKPPDPRSLTAGLARALLGIIGQNDNGVGPIKPRLFAQPIFGFSCGLLGEIPHLLRAAAGEARTQNGSAGEPFDHRDLMRLLGEDFASMILNHDDRKNQDRFRCRKEGNARLGQDIAARRYAQVVIGSAFESGESFSKGQIKRLHPFLTAGAAGQRAFGQLRLSTRHQLPQSEIANGHNLFGQIPRWRRTGRRQKQNYDRDKTHHHISSLFRPICYQAHPPMAIKTREPSPIRHKYVEWLATLRMKLFFCNSALSGPRLGHGPLLQHWGGAS